MYFKIFHPLTIIYRIFFVRACIQNIYISYIIVHRKRNLQVRETEISALARPRPGPKQNTKFDPRPGPDRLGLSDFKTDSFSYSLCIFFWPVKVTVQGCPSLVSIEIGEASLIFL